MRVQMCPGSLGDIAGTAACTPESVNNAWFEPFRDKDFHAKLRADFKWRKH